MTGYRRGGAWVESSVWMSTRVSSAWYTYGRTSVGRSVGGTQEGDEIPSVTIVVKFFTVGAV